MSSILLPVALCCRLVFAAPPTTEPQAESATKASDIGAGADSLPQVPNIVEVEPVAGDQQIVARITRILNATGWFERPKVRVDEGVVFLSGRTTDDEYKVWAGDLARKTRDVVAVVNQIQVTTASAWNFQPALANSRAIGREIIMWIPYGILALGIFIVTFLAAALFTWLARTTVARHLSVPLLQKVIARGIGLLVFLVGLYLVLKICGLTRLALTVVGGTGLAGLVIGIAFRDITENFLASILLSLQSPFRNGDLIEIAGVVGIVQQLNVRTTVLMSLTGNVLQLPNSIVYKSTIRNYSSNPNRREEFTVGIGYSVAIDRAQAVALDVLKEHPAVLKSPEPWVLVDNLGSATVNLRVYFWLDGSEHSWLKVRSSVIRLTKRAFQANGITMPDEAREVVFPKEVPVRIISNSEESEATSGETNQISTGQALEAASVQAESGLTTDLGELEQQARRAVNDNDGDNLLRNSDQTNQKAVVQSRHTT